MAAFPRLGAERFHLRYLHPRSQDIGLAVLIVRNLAMILRIIIMLKKYAGVWPST